MTSERERVLVIGQGPALLGDDGALDAAAATAMRALRQRGHHVIFVTANPATSASDPTVADRTYLEPLDELALRAIVLAEKPTRIVATFGGPRAQDLARTLEATGTLAATRASLTTADALLAAAPVSASALPPVPAAASLLVIAPGPSRIGEGPELLVCAREALAAAREAGFEPVLVSPDELDTLLASQLAAPDAARPAVLVQLGGDGALGLARSLEARGLRVLGTGADSIARAAEATSPGAAIAAAVGRSDAISVSVDAVSDGKRVIIAGLLEHLEPPFVHVGDAAAILPAFTLHPDIVARIEDRVRALALELGIVGLLGVRLAVAGDDVVVLAVEPRAGLTTAFVTRATGFELVRVATKVMLGQTLDALGIAQRPLPRHVAARERVFAPQRTDEGGDSVLGPAMRSTGEAIGLDDTPARAYAKALRGIGFSSSLLGPSAASGASRSVLFAVTSADATAAIELARRFRALGFRVVATTATAAAISRARVPVVTLPTPEGNDEADTIAHEVRTGRIDCAIVTAHGEAEIARTRPLRGACLAARIPCFTTMRLARLGCSSLEEAPSPRIRPLQEWYAADV